MTRNPFAPITKPDVRLATAEGKLRPEDVLAAVNAELVRRRSAFFHLLYEVRRPTAHPGNHLRQIGNMIEEMLK